MVYKPKEDTWLILGAIKGSTAKRALDMGTGTGILAEELAKTCEQVVASDIDPAALEEARKNVSASNVTFVLSDLFSNITGEFDLIVFNAPYLPKEEGGDPVWSGGKELIMNFLRKAKRHLTVDGKIFVVWSSFTKLDPNEVRELGYTANKMAEKRIFFEQLFLYKLTITTP